MQAAGNSTGAEMSDLRNYVMAGLLWDPQPQRPAAGRRVPRPSLRKGRAADPPIHQSVPRPLRGEGHPPQLLRPRRDYAIDESIAKAAMEAFAEALALADSDAVKARVEKASICAYRAAIDRAWEGAEGKKPLEAAEAQQLRPLVKKFLRTVRQVRGADVLRGARLGASERAPADEPGTQGGRGVLTNRR